MSDPRNQIIESIHAMADLNRTEEVFKTLEMHRLLNNREVLNSRVDEQTLLHKALKNLNIKMLTGLLNLGSDPNLISQAFLREQFHKAIDAEKFDMVSAILKAWPEYKKDLINSVDNDGKSFLEKIIRQGNLESLKTFLSEGAIVSPNLIHLAMKEKQYHMFFAMMKTNLRNKNDLINSIDEDGKTLLERAIINGNYEMFKSLLKMGADPSLVPIEPLIQRLHLEANNNLNDLRLFSAILEVWPEHRKTFLNSREKVGYGLIHTFVYYGHIDMVKTLLEMGADPNLTTRNPDPQSPYFQKWTPLHVAAERSNRIELYQLLLKYGADPTKENGQSHTPQELARAKHLPKYDTKEDRAVLILLEKAEAKAQSVKKRISNIEKAMKAYEKEYKKHGAKLKEAAQNPVKRKEYDEHGSFRDDFDELQQAYQKLRNVLSAEKYEELQKMSGLSKSMKKKVHHLHLKRVEIYRDKEEWFILANTGSTAAKTTSRFHFLGRDNIDNIVNMIPTLSAAIKHYQQVYKKAGDKFKAAAMLSSHRENYGEEKFNQQLRKLDEAYKDMINKWTQIDKLYTRYLVQEGAEKNLPEKLKAKMSSIEAEIKRISAEREEPWWQNAQRPSS